MMAFNKSVGHVWQLNHGMHRKYISAFLNRWFDECVDILPGSSYTTSSSELLDNYKKTVQIWAGDDAQAKLLSYSKDRFFKVSLASHLSGVPKKVSAFDQQ